MCSQRSLVRRCVDFHGTGKRGGDEAKKVLKCLTCLLVVVIALSTTGCTPPSRGLLGVAMRSLALEGTYSELKTSMPPVPPGSGRLYIYAIGLGPKPVGKIALFDTMDLCTIDKYVHMVVGYSYWYIDLPPGTHKVTAEGVSRPFGRRDYGKNAVQFDLKEGETKYCRIDLGFFGSLQVSGIQSLTPVMVEPCIAEQQLADHDLDYCEECSIKEELNID